MVTGRPPDRLTATTDALAERLGGFRPRVAIVLGSGLGALTKAVRAPQRIPFTSLPEFPETSVHGHAGELVAGELEGVPVVLQSGRFHVYEGHAPGIVALPVRVFAELGAAVLIVTNAAGGLRPSFRPPVLMLVADHINLMWHNPLIGPVLQGEERFPDMACPYDPGLRTLALETARAKGIALEEGVYAAVLGPSYETPAEIRVLQRLGADAVGMSTVPEVLAARARGLRVLGISSITNVAAGLPGEPSAHSHQPSAAMPRRLSHEEVLAAGKQLASDLETLIRGVLAGLQA